MNWQNRQTDYEEKCIKALQQISPSQDNYEDQQNYDKLIKCIDEKLNPSGQRTPKNNILAIILEEIINLNK